MPTDDVNNPDGTPRAQDSAAADPSGAAPFRAMSLDDLDPEPDVDPAPRLTRRQARARREAGRRGSLPVSPTVGGAFRSAATPPDDEGAADAPATRRPGVPGAWDWSDEEREVAPAPSASPAVASAPPGATATDDSDDDTRANPIVPEAAGEGTSADAPATRPAPPAAAEPEPTVAMPVPSAELAETQPMDALDETLIHPDLDTPAAEPEGARKAPSTAPALAWLDPADIAKADPMPPQKTPDAPPLVPARRRSAWPVIAPIATAVVLAGAYVVGCAVAPLDNLAPTVTKAQIESPAGEEIAVDWPLDGGAALGAVGHTDDLPASSDEVRSMASITKLVTVLMILDEQPLEPGEQGPSYSFTYDDLNEFYGYVYRGESRLEVPVDGSLTQYQMLEGILMASANNYSERLTREVFGSPEEFAERAPEWLEEHGFEDITVVNPSGVDPANAASPADIVRLGAMALENPVIAEIVRKPSVELPGVGEVENSNPLIGEDGVVGIKTGTLLYNYNMVAAKEVEVDGETVTVIATVMGQPDEESRDIVARSLLDQATEAARRSTVVVPAETTAGTVTTAWGEEADLVATDEVSTVLWNGESAEVTSEIGDVLGGAAGDEVGSIEVNGSFASSSTPVVLSEELEGPSLGWRLTHPLELLGLS